MPDEEENMGQGEACEATRMTCDVLCSLSSATAGTTSAQQASAPGSGSASLDGVSSSPGIFCSKQTCPKQLQLPMFLSKTYHMIDRCDKTIAGWGDSGDSFVVKNVEKFASSVLPLYFKHSNFSSFARQLNFYGFRKLRSDPILTTEIDPNTSCYVRFFHENFQKDKPELMHNIKRATKTDMQSKDEVDSLKSEIRKLKDEMSQMKTDYDRKLAELSYDCNRRISLMTAEQDKLALVVQQSLVAAAGAPGAATPVLAGSHDLLHSLSQAAMSLQRHLPPAAVAPPPQMASAAGTKRPADSPDENGKKAKV